MESELDELREYEGFDIIVDTKSALVFIGKLESATEWFLSLADVDVHDMTDSNTTKEIYIMESKKFGINRNRRVAKIRKAEIVSVSKLDDVVVY